MSNKLRILCSSDWHAADRFYDEVKFGVTQVASVVEEHEPDMVALLGDLTHVRGRVDSNSALLVKNAVTAMAGNAKTVVAIPGNHDLYRNGTGSNLDHILGFTDAAGVLDTDLLNVKYSWEWFVESPCPQVGILFVPFYHPQMYGGGTEIASHEDIVADLTTAIQGQLAEMREKYEICLCMTHMTIVGSQFDNEQTMKVGMDLAMPRTAFDGFDLVVSGHLHRPQHHSLGTCELVYIGALTPFTFGDRWDVPSVVEVTIDLDDKAVSWTRIPMQCAQQLLRLEMTADDVAAGKSITISAREFIAERLPAIRAGKCRVRLEASLERARLAMLNKEWVEVTKRALKLDELKMLPRPIDDGLVGDHDSIEGLTFPDLVKMWAEDAGIVLGRKDALVAVAQSIEDGHCAQIHDNAYEHFPIRTKGRNWKQWREFDLGISELPASVCIHGDNAAGKSNLAEAEAFALYGVNLKGTRLANVVREGDDFCSVDHEFISAGERWAVVRMVQLDESRLKAKSTLRLFKLDDRGVRWAQDINTNRETQEKIDSLVGPFEAYMMRFAQQHDIAALIEATDDQRMTILQSLLRYDLDARGDVARKLQDEAKRELIQLNAKLDAEESLMENAIQKLPPEVVSESNEDESDMEVAVRLRFDAEEGCRRTEADIERTEAQLRALSHRRTELMVRQSGLETELRHIAVPDVYELNDAVKAAQQTQADHAVTLARHIEKRPSTPTHEVTDDTLEQLGTQMDAILSDLAERQGKVDSYERQLRTASARASERSGTVEALKKYQSPADVPCVGWKWLQVDPIDNEVDDEPVSMDGCPLLKNITLMQQQFTDAYNGMVDARRDVAQLEKKLNRHEDALAVLKEKYETVAANREAAMMALRRQSALAEWQAERDRLEERVQTATTTAEAALQALKEGRKLTQELMDDTQRIQAELAKLEQSVENVNKGEKTHTVALAALRAERDAYIKTEQRMETAERLLLEADAHRMEARRLRSHIATSEDSITVFQLYRDACHRRGIPLIFLKRVLPEYVRTVNEMLAPVDLRYEMDTVKLTTTGEERVALDQWFVDSTGRHPVKEASGFQRVVLGVALRLSLTKLHADLTGSEVSTVWQDEGWGAFSAENIPVAMELIQQISLVLGGRYVYITHVAELQDTASARIMVRKTDSGPVAIVVQ